MSWHEKAKCTTINPDHFDVHHSVRQIYIYGPRDEFLKVMDMGTICNGCPVTADCARTALNPLAEGTIRGGIPIPLIPSKLSRQVLVNALQEVAAGTSPTIVRTLMAHTLAGLSWKRRVAADKKRGVAS